MIRVIGSSKKGFLRKASEKHAHATWVINHEYIGIPDSGKNPRTASAYNEGLPQAHGEPLPLPALMHPVMAGFIQNTGGEIHYPVELR
jgi:hypothetical protein